jgi:hypothetical protein
MSDMTRRQLMGGALAGAAAGVLLNHAGAAAEECKALKTYPNEHFYKSDGTFDVDAAKAAYYEMFEHHHYPIVPRLRGDEFWAVDFGLGKFTEVGMAGIFWLNLKDENYFGHEIYLLPGQMIPEHRHVLTPDAGPKLESWQVRHGWVHIYGEGEPTPGVDARIPPSHRDCCKARTETKLMPGEVGHLGGPEQWHWMRAGDEGGIVTEYATYHDGAALRFSLDAIVF